MTDYTLFETRPGVSVLLLPDAPTYTIVAVSNDFILTSGMSREGVLGKGLFEVFPEVGNDPAFGGGPTVRASFQHVLRHKETHQLGAQRFDLPAAGGGFSERWWTSVNVPVLNEGGAVQYIIHTSEDITVRVKAGQQEERLKKLSEAYDVFMQAPVAVCIVKDPDYTVELANELMLRFLGRTSEMVGKPLITSLTEADKQGLIAILDRVRTTGETYHTARFPAELLVDGVRVQRYFDLVFKPYYQFAGDTVPTSIFCVAHNVTEQVLSQKEMEESEHRFRTLIEEASVATALYLGREHRIAYANDIMLGYWGKGHSVIGVPLGEAVPELQGQPFLDYFDAVYTTGNPQIGVEEEAWLNVDGKLQPFYYDYTYKALRDKEGVIYGIHHMAVDATERVLARRRLEESRQELQLAMEVAGLGTFRVDLLNNSASNSENVSEWFGLYKPSYSLEESFRLIHPEDRGRVEQAIQHTLVSEAVSRHDISYRVVNAGNGSIRHLRSFGRTLFHEGGKPYLIIGMIQDITPQMLQRRQLEQSEAELQRRVLERTVELENLNRELQRSNKNLEEFAYAASHDMKEPIRKIRYFADRLGEGLHDKLDEQHLRLFSRMQLAADRMNTLIDDLLTYSHVSVGAEQPEPIDLNKKVQEVLHDLELEIEQKGARITVGVLPVIRGQRRQLQQLFQNLIGNALKYSKPGEAPEVEISSRVVVGNETGLSLTPEQEGRRYHLLAVKDNGIGFAGEDAERIFQVFTRLHGNAEYRGSGVGLAIVQRVVQNHQGFIWAESDLGKGATFKVLLPLENHEQPNDE